MKKKAIFTIMLSAILSIGAMAQNNRFSKYADKIANTINSKTGSTEDSSPKEYSYGNVNSGANSYVEVVNGVSFKMIFVEGSTFFMGAAGNDNDARENEKLHQVTLNDYFIAETEVTQELWEAVMGTTVNQQRRKAEADCGYDLDLGGVGNNLPMYYVSWDDCQEFIAKLNEMTGKNYYLPTEAQWEYAARGDNKSRNCIYSGSNTIDQVAWYGLDYTEDVKPVASKMPNELGIYDMSGSVWEWCHDWYDEYPSKKQVDPRGPAYGSTRVNRGGNWLADANFCRVATRDSNESGERIKGLGFRLAIKNSNN